MAAKRDWDYRRRAGTAEDLRGAQDPQRSDIHRRVSDARFLPPIQTILVRLHAASDAYEIESREFPKIKKQLLFNLTNVGRPLIAVRDGNYKNRGELFLEHTYSGVELKNNYALDTLTNLHRLWGRPVHIETVLDGANDDSLVRRQPA